jgi:hypothetical protein
VKLGRASANSVEILSGLQPADKVVLSDMSTWDVQPHPVGMKGSAISSQPSAISKFPLSSLAFSTDH